MANFEYKNIKDILSTNKSIRGTRIDIKQQKKIVVPKFEYPTSQSYGVSNIELHAFLPNTAYIASLYNVNTWKVEPNPSNKDNKVVSLDIHRDVNKPGLKLTPGPYRVVYNFNKDLVGNVTTQPLFVHTISDDRKELKLKLVTPNDETTQTQLIDFIIAYLSPSKYLQPIILNFGENKILDIINVTSDGDPNQVYVKLYDPLPTDILEDYTCWISSQILSPWIDTVNVIPEELKKDLQRIAGPNFEVDYDYWITTETDYKSWNEILSTNLQTSQDILSRYITSSGVPVSLNIDFTEFENFVFYSSAQERVHNFVYKIGLIEHYNSQLELLNTYTGSVDSNKIKVRGLRDRVIGGFDDFEKWMYYEVTASSYYTYQTSSTVTPFPKYEVTGSDYHILNKYGKYKLYSTGSNEVDDWYMNIAVSASNYDLKNYNSLDKTIPEFIRDDEQNDQYVTFVNMIGQHFDIIYLYTDHLLNKNVRSENPRQGLTQDLIYETTKNLGWTLTHGTQAKDLWEYALGVSGSGEPVWTGKTSIDRYHSKTEEERTKEVWRRVLNNLPYIYKTKGTARGIKALLAAYGIPQTLLTIREFGGPDNADLGIIPKAEWEKHTYYLNFHGSLPLPTTQQYVRVPWEKVNNVNGTWQYPDTLTFRWKMEPNKLYDYRDNLKQTLLQKNAGSRVDWFVTMDKNGTDVEKGTLTFYIGDGTNYKSASFYDEYMYDDVPLNLMIRRSSSFDSTSLNQTYDIFLKTAKYGKVVIERSASISITGSTESNYNRAWASDGYLFIGSGSNPQTNNILSGSIFDLRYWSSPLDEKSFDNHVCAARAYNGNTSTSSFYDLQAQFKFWQPFDAAVTTSLWSTQPDHKKSSFYTSSKTAYLYGFTSSSFESIVETYNMEVATVGNNTPFSEKVRIDSSSLIGTLNADNTVEVSAFDMYSVDSNKLMVAFSPQSTINEDIYSAIGNTSIDDYFGEYSSIDKEEYPRLKWFAREYWQKYPNKNDFTAYIRLISIFDFSIFDQIRQTLPARVNGILGVVVEPNVLERSKVKVLRDFYADPLDKVVRDTNEISSSITPSLSINSKTTTIKIGFDDDGSVVDKIDGEFDIINEVDAYRVEEYSTDVDMVPKPYALQNKYIASISSSRGFLPKPISTYHKYIGNMKNHTSSLKTIFTPIKTTVKNNLSSNLFGDYNILDTLVELNTAFTINYSRINVEKTSSTTDYGYGEGWVPINNDEFVSTAYYSTIESYVNDNYYSAYDFIYSSDLDLANRNYSGYTLVSSSYVNPHNLTTGTRHHRFEGIKLSGPDIGVNSTQTPDGKPVVEVFFVDAQVIAYDERFSTTAE